MKRIFFAVASLLIATSTSTLSAQSSDFKPSGKAIVKVFADYFYNSQDGKSNTGFELTRSYLGYGYNFSEHISGKALLDVANNASGSAYTAFLKNALVEYKDKSITVDFGMIGTSSFDLQESYWGKRYLRTTVQDYAGISYSADLGASIKVKASPIVSFDAAVLNGEGYKKVQADSTLKLTAGVTVTPIKGLAARLYVDYLNNNKSLYPAGKDETTFSAFLGYSSKKASAGFEYNYQKNNKLTADMNLSAFSVFGTMAVAPKWNVFARYDHLSSKNDVNATGSSLGADGSLYVGGLEYSLIKGVRVSPNLQVFDPKMSDGKTLVTGFFNLEMAF